WGGSASRIGRARTRLDERVLPGLLDEISAVAALCGTRDRLGGTSGEHRREGGHTGRSFGDAVTIFTTSIGESRVSHRLALAVECIDAMTKRTASAPVQIIRENDVPNSTPAQRYVRTDPGFVPRGPGRALLLHGRRPTTSVTVRISDTARQFVPRR